MSETIKLTGIVLSVFPIGETSKRLTILTKERGKLQVFSNGCRRPNSPLFAVSQPLVYGEFLVLEGRSSCKLSSAEGIDYFPHLKDDLESIYYSTYFAELAEFFTAEGMDERNILNLLFVTFSAMKRKQVPLKLIRRIFEFRLLAYHGIGLETFLCVSCGRTDKLTAISMEEGGLLCEECRKKRRASEVEADVVYTLQYLSTIPLTKLYSFVLSEKIFLEFDWIVKHFLRYHVDHTFKSEEMLEIF